jgi:hypothetical protein
MEVADTTSYSQTLAQAEDRFHQQLSIPTNFVCNVQN